MDKPATLGYYAGSHWFMSAVAIVLVSLFSLWLVAALLDAEEMAEKMVVESDVRNMRVGLKVAMGEALIAGREDEIARWPGSNPIRWLGAPPTGYLGDCPPLGEVAMPEASWCFDGPRQQLLYRPRHDRHLQLTRSAEVEKTKILRWQVLGRAQKAVNSNFVAVSVQLLTPYLWLKE